MNIRQRRWKLLTTPDQSAWLHADFDGLMRARVAGMTAIPTEIDAIREARLSDTVVFIPPNLCGAKGRMRLPANGTWIDAYRNHAEAFAKEMGYDLEIWK